MEKISDNTKLKELRGICLANAEALLSAAERELPNNMGHIPFHLALLALEEIGKITLATIGLITLTGGREEPALVGSMDDHQKKIFWAIWGNSMRRDTKLTKESIDQSRDLAENLHNRRLETLYTDESNPLPVEKRIEEKEADMIVKFVRARLELEKAHSLIDFEEEDVDTLTWYFNAVDDPEKRKHMFSSVSLKKMAELENGKEWMKWLRGVFQKNEDEMRELARKELERKEPQGEEREKPKYKMRVRIQTPSHSIRNNAFTKWNEGVHNIKLFKSDRKDAQKLTKGEILMDFTFQKTVPPHALWEHGMFMVKTTVISFNVATLGVFWWNVPKDIEKYYEKIDDLEADPNGNVGFVIAPQKRLHVGFDEAKLVLDENAVRNVYHVLGLFFSESKMLEDFLKAYAMGLTCFSKTDIHLRLEVNAFEEFSKALKIALMVFGDWDGKSDFKEAAIKQIGKAGEMKELEKTLKLVDLLEADPMRQKHHPITLTEVIAMKIYCDYYIQVKAKEYYEKKDKGSEQSE